MSMEHLIWFSLQRDQTENQAGDLMNRFRIIYHFVKMNTLKKKTHIYLHSLPKVIVQCISNIIKAVIKIKLLKRIFQVIYWWQCKF